MDGELRAAVDAPNPGASTVYSKGPASAAAGLLTTDDAWAKPRGPAPGEARRATRWLSLRTKGVLAMLVLIGYPAVIAVFLANERQGLVTIVQQMEANQARIGLIEPVLAGLARALAETPSVVDVQEAMRSPTTTFHDPGFRLQTLSRALDEVALAFPALGDDVGRYKRAAATPGVQLAVSAFAPLRDVEQLLLAKLQHIRSDLESNNRDLSQQYRSTQQFIGVFATSANVVGAVVCVAVILVFFTRLARDINHLKERASAIVSGYDGPPLPKTRRDEIGGLIDAVNRMQADLRRAESQMELARQQRFHQEKMAAVGSLASAIGHEVSNPIAAISGVAQFLVDESAADPKLRDTKVGEFAGQILKQTERIAHIVRQMTTLTAPRSPEPELLDLNALVRSTAGFIRYDKRFRGVEFQEALAQDLPAVTAVADHLTQVLINLLINSADATDHLVPPAPRRIRLATGVAGDSVLLSVSDNGRGMTPEVRARAFDETFTTKPVGQGRGIGLFVCKNLVERGGGRIELASAPDAGTIATVHIPLAQSGGATI
ncbi:MAG TPA: ATP-binding protein [Casimicrobiaceae bacterium]|nr:ATP-binding protein [Casimicrobiaceae bacterium]